MFIILHIFTTIYSADIHKIVCDDDHNEFCLYHLALPERQEYLTKEQVFWKQAQKNLEIDKQDLLDTIGFAKNKKKELEGKRQILTNLYVQNKIIESEYQRGLNLVNKPLRYIEEDMHGYPKDEGRNYAQQLAEMDRHEARIQRALDLIRAELVKVIAQLEQERRASQPVYGLTHPLPPQTYQTYGAHHVYDPMQPPVIPLKKGIQENIITS